MNLHLSASGSSESPDASPLLNSGSFGADGAALFVPSSAEQSSPAPSSSSSSGFAPSALVEHASPVPASAPTLGARLFSFVGLGVAGAVMSAVVFLGARGPLFSVAAALVLALCGMASVCACGAALGRAGGAWPWRIRLGWGAITLFCALGTGEFFWQALQRRRGAGGSAVSLAVWLSLGAQGALWLGLLFLAWRGKTLGALRLLADTLIVTLAALVLLWSPARGQGAAPWTFVKFAVLGGPMASVAQAFGVSMLWISVRDRPALSRASWFLLGAVACGAASCALGFAHIGAAPWPAILRGWEVLLVGMAAIGSAPVSRAEEDAPGAPLSAGAQKAGELLARSHRAALRWFPYLAAAGASCVLLRGELRGAPAPGAGLSQTGLLPMGALLLALAARQMITLWDNLQLAEQLRSSTADLEQNVNERTRHLATLHGITSTLNTSLDRRTILRVTLERIIGATGADAGGIWLRETRRDVYEGDAPHDEWILMHWQGGADPSMPSLLRDLSIAEASEGEGLAGDHFHLSPATRHAMQTGLAPPRQRLILIPVRWQGVILGVMGLMRESGAFTYEDRALVESVALEAGAALQNARMYSEAAHRADRDSVTDLLNHRAVQEQMTTTLSRCKRSGGVFSIVMMDLNNFKFFNDTYGHPVGDDVLRTVARGLRDSCRGSDILGRYGGDEFIVVLPDTDTQGTLDVCERIRAALDAKHFEPVPGTRLPIGTAFGWAAFPGDGETIMELLSAADANLYNHKRGGASYLSQSQKAVQEDRDALKKLKNRAHGGSFGVLDALVTAIDNKDHYTRQHSEEVTYLSLLVAREVGYSSEQLEAVRIAGLLHDVGKIAVPDQILRHPGKLGRDEWDIMQQHPVFGALIVKDVPQLDHVLDGIRFHHEKWDGSGYPEKRVGEDIPEMGRLLAMGDCYSALTTDRPYRKGWKPEAALEEIERCAGTHFDPHLCAVFLEVMRRELVIGADTSDYGSRIAEDFGTEREVEPEAVAT